MLAKTEEYADDHYLVTHEVDSGAHGMRIDRFLKERYRKRSRVSIQDAIERGAITISREQGAHYVLGGKLKASTQLLYGDRVLVMSERKAEPEVNFNYRILHDEPSFMVIDKPGNLPVHPAGRYFFHSLLVHLRTHGLQDPLPPGRDYFLVHRIDRETSGLLVLARTREAAAHITRQFADRIPEKRYLAIVHGIVPETFVVEAPMRRSLTSRVEIKMETCEPGDVGAMTAITRFKRLRITGEYSVVECAPETGRQHQIRVHLEKAGHPLVGDKLYGMDEDEAYRYFESKFISPEAQAKLLIPRHALHAAGIRFHHPDTNEVMEFQSDLPEDLQSFLSGNDARESAASPLRRNLALPAWKRASAEYDPAEVGMLLD